MLAQLLTVAAFVFITAGIGCLIATLSRITRAESWLVRTLEVFGLGLVGFSFLNVAFSLLQVPIYLWVYLVVAAIGVVGVRSMSGTASRAPGGRQEIAHGVILLLLLGATFVMFHHGANVYPWLEDDDSWTYAQGAVFVARTHSTAVTPAMTSISPIDPASLARLPFGYLAPYPPAYTILMGVLRQANPSVLWTLKFFNVMLVTLALAFYYLFFRKYLRSANQALAAVIVLACIPSFMTHFIWSQSLALALFPVALYALLQATENRSWGIPAVVAVAAVMVSQIAVTLMFIVVVGLFTLVIWLHELLNVKRRFRQTHVFVLSAAVGGFVGGIFWITQMISASTFGNLHATFMSGYTSEYALTKHTLHEVVFAPLGRIDEAAGWGVGVTIALAMAVILWIALYQKTLNVRSGWQRAHLFAWLLLLLYVVLAPTFGLPSFGSSRVWPYLAIPVALIIGEAVFITVSSVTKHPVHNIIVVALVVLIIAVPSIPPKYRQQTAQWPAGVLWTSLDELSGYVAMHDQLPAGTRVYQMCADDRKITGFDMESDFWVPEVMAFRQRGMNITLDELQRFMDQHRYSHVVIDETCVKSYGRKTTQTLVSQFQSDAFRPLIFKPGFLLLQRV